MQFIYDFVQKTKILCISHFHNAETFDGKIDISKFRNLEKLEINHVDISKVNGIQQMRAHLHEITCVRSINAVQDIISHCGGDESNGFVWNELKTANFAYNSLEKIDNSLEFAPWLQYLDLSHNKLISLDAIKWLQNLKVLNLSFNHLSHIPLFHRESKRRLKVLTFSNNFIEDISGSFLSSSSKKRFSYNLSCFFRNITIRCSYRIRFIRKLSLRPFDIDPSKYISIFAILKFNGKPAFMSSKA